MLHHFHIEIVDAEWRNYSLATMLKIRRLCPAAMGGCDEYGDPTGPVAWPTMREDLASFTKRHTGLVLRVTVDNDASTTAYVADGKFQPSITDEEYSACLR